MLIYFYKLLLSSVKPQGKIVAKLRLRALFAILCSALQSIKWRKPLKYYSIIVLE